jgi:hypothetical protein
VAQFQKFLNLIKVSEVKMLYVDTDWHQNKCVQSSPQIICQKVDGILRNRFQIFDTTALAYKHVTE